MARIRSIKPEFPTSESLSRCSRDARLLFVTLWTLADDEGRLRGNSQLLASSSFPYDEDALKLIEGWLTSLEEEGCIIRYKVGGNSYLQITNWSSHQKIDKPTPSKLPPPSSTTRTDKIDNPREIVETQREGLEPIRDNPKAIRDVVETIREDSRVSRETSSEERKGVGEEGRGVDQERNPTSVEKRTKPRQSAPKTVLDADRTDSLWVEFCREYPKRDGPTDKAEAERKFKKLASEGMDMAAVVRQAKAYSDWSRASGKWGTQYVRRMSTWFNGKGWLEDYGESQPPPELDDQQFLDEIRRRDAEDSDERGAA